VSSRLIEIYYKGVGRSEEQTKWSGIAQKGIATINVIVFRCHASDIISVQNSIVLRKVAVRHSGEIAGSSGTVNVVDFQVLC
jgi:hypothetical protein